MVDKTHKNSKNLIIGINIVDFSSSGNIMINSLKYAHENGDFDYYIFVPKSHYSSPVNTFQFAKKKMSLFQRFFYNRVIKERKRQAPGFCGHVYTKRIISKVKSLEKVYPNLILHFHTIHAETIDMYKLFKCFGKDKHITHIFVTAHDSWYYTGGCCSFYYKKCFKWEQDNSKCKFCSGVSNKAISSKGTYYYLKRKKQAFEFIKNKTTIIAVSNWLNNNLKKSVLSNIPSIVIHGETSLEHKNSNPKITKASLGLNNKKILLVVTYYWHKLKGPEYIYKIAEMIPNDYVIMIVGDKLDTRSFNNIVNIGIIDDMETLSNYYSLADVYISTSQEESLGLTTCEAQICGTPVVAFGHAGIKETISPKSGIIIGEDNNIDRMVEAIKQIIDKKPFKTKDIIDNGLRFSKYTHSKTMLKLYNLCFANNFNNKTKN